jgi:hypothetical protein
MADDGVPSSWAIGWTAFAGMMMVLVGTLHIIAGIAGIAKDDVLVRAQDYTFQFSTTTWGWIHLIAGIVVLGSGLAIFSGSVFARTTSPGSRVGACRRLRLPSPTSRSAAFSSWRPDPTASS